MRLAEEQRQREIQQQQVQVEQQLEQLQLRLLDDSTAQNTTAQNLKGLAEREKEEANSARETRRQACKSDVETGWVMTGSSYCCCSC